MRFFMPIGFSVLASIVSIYLLERESISTDVEFRLLYLVHTSILAIPFSIAVVIIGERWKFSITYKILANVGILLLAVAYFLLLPEEFSNKVLYRGALLTIAIHLLVSYLPFIKGGNLYSFWDYNRKLFERVIITALYSMVIYGGVSIAVLVANYLFNLDIDEKFYFEFWILVVGVFATIMFLAGFPKKYENEDKSGYPIGLKIFTQFVLLPLVTLYFLILYGYIVKVIAAWEIPQGITSYLVIAFSVLGILSLLLVYPVQNSDKFKWIKIFSKIFYWAIFPLIALLSISIYLRISQYGITENRYFVLALALWLVGISIYLLINKLENIKIIPISLSIIAILSAFGPWGAFNVSQVSQLRILKKNLEENNILVDGKINKNIEIDWEANSQIRDRIEYLIENHGHKKVEKLVNIQLDSSLTKNGTSPWQVSNAILDSLGIGYAVSEATTVEGGNFYISTRQDYNRTEIKDVRNYDYFFNMNAYAYDGLMKEDISLDSNSLFTLELDKEVLNIYFTKEKNTSKQSYNFTETVDKLTKKHGYSVYDIEPEKLTLNIADSIFDCKLIIKNLNGYKSNDSLIISDLNTEIYLNIK